MSYLWAAPLLPNLWRMSVDDLVKIVARALHKSDQFVDAETAWEELDTCIHSELTMAARAALKAIEEAGYELSTRKNAPKDSWQAWIAGAQAFTEGARRSDVPSWLHQALAAQWQRGWDEAARV